MSPRSPGAHLASGQFPSARPASGQPVRPQPASPLFTGPPRLLAVGEPTHGSEPLLRQRNDLFRSLVERHGYRTIAIESDCLMGLIVDEYVAGGAGTLDDVMKRGFSHEWGAFEGNRELVQWMREHNTSRDAAARIRFAGFDGPLEITAAASPREALTGLRSACASALPPSPPLPSAQELDDLLGADERWTNPAAMMDPSQSIGRTTEALRLRVLADEMAGLVEAWTPQLGADVDRARLYARTALGLLRYHYAMADTSPHRIERLLGVRDSMMAANLLALAERGPTLANGQNAHFQRHKSSMRMGGRQVEWWSAGAIADVHLGTAYGFLAGAAGTIRAHGVEVPPPDTVEGSLYALSLPEGRFVGRVPETPGAARVSPWFGYAPLDPSHLGDVDGIVFVKDA
ncbi:putative erythromycin esterase [Actinoplanes missouriensis 431]|uniref:Putative erythromycin esterase n=1 Tax=Actinoplanes missouriensis (strain ATCC 14538 / DSM 43046 / CBS 188.64 / JCM 3121 / NBRC 102363 / NCIMB 12654 / NRRL B-3342 / UNCC 431) TaxID=512565 RepID=I0H908_ACTM4|nr:putative erythromycin esterase [Actinoplanes missouriensis 431]